MAERSRKKGLIINVIIVVVLIAGWFIIRKSGFTTKNYQYYAYYKTVKGLQASSSVEMHGVRIGKIADIDLNDSNDVRVTLSIRKNIQIPEGTIAVLSSGGVTGERIIELHAGKGPGMLHDFSTISTLLDTNTKQSSIQITPYIQTAKSILSNADTTLRGLKKLIGSGVVSPLAKGINALEGVTDKYEAVSEKLNKQTDGIAGGMQNASASAAKIEKNSREWPGTIRNADTSTKKLTVNDFNKNIKELQSSIKKLNTGFSKLNNTDKASYINAVKSIDSFTADLKETKEHPKGMSILGKSKKK